MTENNESEDSGSEEEEDEPLFHTFIKEAINSIPEGDLGRIEHNPDEVKKAVRKRLAEILVDKISIKEHWKFDPDLQRLSKAVNRYMKNEKDKEYYPAIRHALQQRKFAINKLIQKNLSRAEDGGEDDD